MLGLRRERSSPMMSRPVPSRGSPRDRSPRKATSTRSMDSAAATTELALPGLETPEAVTHPVPTHWLERGPRKRLMVFSGRSHPALATRIAEHLGVDLGDVELKTFADGETYFRY